jgi:excisionase family DNA binding protein
VQQAAAPSASAANPRQVAQRLGLGLATIRRLIRRGELPASRVGSRVIVLDRDVDALLERGRIAPAPAPAAG